MSKRHPHHDLIVAWAADTTRVVQSLDSCGEWQAVDTPHWYPTYQYRFNPLPKPDAVHEASVQMLSDTVSFVWYPKTPNMRFTFDGETGALKRAEVLK